MCGGVVCRALPPPLIINSHSDLTSTSTVHSFYFLTSPSTVSSLITSGGEAGNESLSLMSTLNLWRLCWWSSDSAPVHSETESLQSSAGEGRWTGPGMAKLAALALAVGGFHNLPTEVAMQAAPGTLAFALVRDSNPTSWL